MTIKTQFQKIKENWLLIVLLVIALLVVSTDMPSIPQIYAKNSMDYIESAEAGIMLDEDYSMKRIASSYYAGGDFAPEIEERKITKTASLTTEIKRGQFKTAEKKLKNIVDSSSSFLLNERVNKYDKGIKEYYSGWYSIKVDTEKYDSVISQLKDIGEVMEFNENANDITGTYTDLEVELETEKSRLTRYKAMYDEAEDMNDKITLNDRIYQQERTIKYYEERLENMDSRIEYTTISMSINEKRSKYFDVEFIGFSRLIKTIVNSINSLLSLIFFALPYAIAIGIVYFAVKRFKKKKK